MKRYQIFGPFELSRTPYGFVDDSKEARSDFWEIVENTDEDLCYARGCYIFCTGGTKNLVPRYVGKTNGENGFYGEVFQSHKVKIYYKVLQHLSSKPSPKLLFIARMTPKGRFARSIPEKEVDWLEKMLIGAARTRNENLGNQKDTKLLQELIVPGFLGSWGRGTGRSKSVQALRKCLF